MKDSKIAAWVIENMNESDIIGLKSEPIFKIMIDFFKNGKALNPHELKERMSPALFSALSEALQEQTQPPTVEEARDCLFSLHQFSLESQADKLKADILKAEKNKEVTRLQSLLKKYQDIKVKLSVDFKKLRYVNSTGLGILLHISRAAKEKEGCFKIANINENVYEIIEIIGATSLLEIYDNMEMAISSLE